MLRDDSNGNIIWESFEHPSVSFLQKMKISSQKFTDERTLLTSWKSSSDPSTGSFTCGLNPLNIPELYAWNGSHPHWRSGPYNRQIFFGLPDMVGYCKCLDVVDDKETVYISYTSTNESVLYHFLNSDGIIVQRYLDIGMENWEDTLTFPQSKCEIYGNCGPFGICNTQDSPICTCLQGFHPKDMEEWSRGTWTSGCVRRRQLQCERNNSDGGEKGKEDGFLKLKTVKVPAFAEWLSISEDICKSQCLNNCSCIAYSYYSGFGCMQWSADLIDIQEFSYGGADLYIRVAYTEIDIAVKRLSKSSGQGMEEFMNEVVVISQLQHHNLVRLLGYCVEEEEKMLIYEYMLSKSLDVFLFDWRKRANIVEGIGRGLLYLHRDLKTNNVLLDEDLNPKISDFGMAKIFGSNQDQANTKRLNKNDFTIGVVMKQCNGYMAPEYAMQGRFSEKFDVFSFGVLLLEIVSGQKNTSFNHDEESLSLQGLAWKLWNEDKIVLLIDPMISDSCFQVEILRYIHVGLLCVQDFAKDRPTIFTSQRRCSANNITVTTIDGR
ncbi:G-type lectin S-receptor-like serine/threonine-protein kinase At1g11330 [Cornus florida]|uniref:G-type lectin S-receptor-like serine/threonine-protein kinase At1g11330 n=1 Tax=Cornus florida TaxID=4283 RepID=UPI00289E5BC0|nr:G-type lectin S-receptor-like serine/threonine-protein kinase At1g11330 [Cornus florida]